MQHHQDQEDVEPKAKRSKSEESAESGGLYRAILKQLIQSMDELPEDFLKSSKSCALVPGGFAARISYGDQEYIVDSDILVMLPQEPPKPETKPDTYIKLPPFDWDNMFGIHAKHTALQALNQVT